MQSTIRQALKLTAGLEGGYSNHKNDPGGPTMKGVTLKVYQAFAKRKGRGKPGIAELQRISDADVEEIFREQYWNGVRGDDLPAGVDFAAGDFAFNSGSVQAAKDLQRTVTGLGFDAGGADGRIGELTLKAVREALAALGEDAVINAYLDRRWAFMQKLKNFPTFKNGWKARIASVRKNALAVAHGDPVYTPLPVAGMDAKAYPTEARTTALPGVKPAIVAIGGAVASAATEGAKTMLDSAAGGELGMLPYLLVAFLALSAVAAGISIYVLKNRQAEDTTL